MINLRDYQREAWQAVAGAWDDGTRAPAVVLPTGTGKTVIFSAGSQELIKHGARPWVLVHRDELVRQTVEKMLDYNPAVQIGVVQAERNELGRPYTVASVATLARASRRALVPPDACTHMIVDEAHHATAASYRAVRDHFSAANVVGFTATMRRGDSGHLGDVWDRVVYSRDIEWAIANNYLVDVRGKKVTVEGLSLADVARKRGGDYADGSLGEAMTEAGAGKAIAQAIVEHAGDRQGILFCPSVATAYAWAEDLTRAGVSNEVVVGTTPIEERQLTYKRVLAGEIRYIVSCMVLTEGFDLPILSCAVIARPTTNEGLYIQMGGRVLRPAPGKTDALILDVVGAAGTMSLASLAVLTRSKSMPEDGETLMSAAKRLAARGSEVRKLYSGSLDGDISVEDIDLFAARPSVWLKTKGGKWFIPTSEGVFFLWPAEGGTKFAVGRTASAYRLKGPNSGWLAEGRKFDLSMAMSWAEQAAMELDPSVSARSSRWRKTRMSERQTELLNRLNLAVPDSGLKSDASDLISAHYASAMLDR